MLIQINEREHATILAALRAFQRLPSEYTEPENDIATNGGEFDALTIMEIDELCERVNSEQTGARLCIFLEGGVVSAVVADGSTNIRACFTVDYDTDADADNEALLIPQDSGEPAAAYVGQCGIESDAGNKALKLSEIERLHAERETAHDRP